MNTPVCIEARQSIAAPAEVLYRLYTDAASWHEWDPDTRSARFGGPPVPGTRGWLRPSQGWPVRMRILVADPGRRFSVECPVLGSRMRFDHDIADRQGGGVEVLHRVVFSGWLAPWLDRTVGERVRAGLPRTLERLKAHAEARARPGP